MDFGDDADEGDNGDVKDDYSLLAAPSVLLIG